MTRTLVLCGSVLLVGCIPAAAPEPPTPLPLPPESPISAPAPCDANPAQRLLGQQATAETGAMIQAATGASIFQWVAEGSAVTMDYRTERVRVEYDTEFKIIGITCG